MAYLRLRDYYNLIQDKNLTEVIRNDDSLRLSVEKTAQDEVSSYIVQQYDVSDEFIDTVVFNLASTFNAKQLVYLDGPLFLNTSTYATNDIVSESGVIYYSKVSANTNHQPSTSPTQWGILGSQYAFFNIPAPYPEFDYKQFYTTGDIVFWRNKVYKCTQPSIVPSHNDILQFDYTKNIPYINNFPDASPIAYRQWSTGTQYNFSGLLITALPADFTAWSSVTTYVIGNRVSFNSMIWQAIVNSTNVQPGSDIITWMPVSWLSGDNRSTQLVQRMIDITLYHLHSGIAPRNIPELRVKRYDDAITWLTSVGNNEVSLDSPRLQPGQGYRIRYGGNIKNNNIL